MSTSIVKEEKSENNNLQAALVNGENLALNQLNSGNLINETGQVANGEAASQASAKNLGAASEGVVLTSVENTIATGNSENAW